MVARKRPEQMFHRQVAEFLSVALGGAAWWSTMPLGGGGQLRGAILKGVGVKSGLPDILLVDGGRAIWLELKARKGRLSDVQKECHKALHHAGSAVHVVRTIEELIQALRSAGVPLRITRGEAASIEEQKKYSDENRCSATSIGSLAPSVERR